MPAEAPKMGALRSGAFRFALLLAAVFALGSALVLAVVQRQVGDYALEAGDASLKTEMSILAGEYRSRGLDGLIDTMARHQKATGEAQFHYLLLDARGHTLYGDLPRRAAGIGFADAPAERGPHDREEENETLRRLGAALPGGLQLTIASDTFDVGGLRSRLLRFTLWSGVGITVFALGGGFLVGSLFLRRLERVNRAVDRIIAGSHAERLPSIGLSPEFDRLSANLNHMLDRNAALMEGLRQVSTDIAHDLRTPLTRLHQQLQRIRDEPLPDAAAAGIEDSLAQTEQILATFHALLRIGALEGGAAGARFGDVDLSEVMDRVHLAYGPVAEDRGHRLRADHERGVIVKGDADLLAQMVTNLIENALVHTPPGSVVETRLAHEGARVIAEVSDDGPGIPAAETDKVFRRFYRLDASRNTAGSGLGLAMVSAIAGVHGADVRVVDNRPGLRVQVILPAGEGRR